MTACAFVPADAEQNDQARQEADTAAPDLSAFLIRDPALQTELGLSPDQRRAIRTFLDETDGPLWALRDLAPKEAGEKLRPLVVRVENGLAGLLDARQRSRLDQIAVQYRGLPALLDPDWSGKLSLNDDQRGQIQSIVRETRLTLRKLEERGRNGERRDVLEDTAGRLRTDGREKILAILTDAQKRQWATLMGEAFDLSRVNPLAVKAPELREASAWVNSESLTLAKLRGRVVALHFWTFGCSNCIHNYPAYKAWHTAYSQKGLTILGIHTPETQGEHNIESVRTKAGENGLTFPILVDNDRKNWDAWSNNIWPSVYLIDKKGCVRYWWYGELNWQGAEGEKWMRERIDELLAEDREVLPSRSP